MRSKAHIKSHPLHPILISFPVAFYTGTFIFDAIGFISNKPALFSAGHYLNLAAIIGAVLAAIPGIIDYVKTVPPASSAKKRAGQHGLINSTVLIIFTIAYFTRDNFSYLQLLLEFIGLILTLIAGWMGGTLVFRNQIGVDVRYADAGKWNEAYLSGDHQPVEVANASELNLNQMKLIHLGDKRIVIARTEDGFVGFDDRCPHKGGSFAGGSLICGTVQCPWHGSQYDVHTGASKCGPGKDPIKTYHVFQADSKVFLDVQRSNDHRVK